jgi:hypothetical protein
MKINFNINFFILFIYIIFIFYIFFSFYKNNKSEKFKDSKEVENDDENNDENDDENDKENNEKKIVYITSIYGDYEKTCKPFIKQTIPSDFICFSNNKNLINNGWIIDNTEYHLINKSDLDKDEYINSLNKKI